MIFILEKMSFSVRFNAEDEEVEGLCTTPTKSQSTGIFFCIYLATINKINYKHILWRSD